MTDHPRRMMDLRQLEYFMAVAEEGSFTRGARRLHSAQSAASASVARLEREIGQPLFLRGTRRLELTEAGRVLLARARSIQDQALGARAELDALRDGLVGTVTIGTILAFGSTVLPRALDVFHRRLPKIAIQLGLSAGPIDEHLTKPLDFVALRTRPPVLRRPPNGTWCSGWSVCPRTRNGSAPASSPSSSSCARDRT